MLFNQPLWGPWIKAQTCAQVDLFFSLSKPSAAGEAQQIRIRLRNNDEFDLKLTLTAHFKSLLGHVTESALTPVTVAAGKEVTPPELVLTPFPAQGGAQPEQLAQWGFKEINVERVDTNKKVGSCEAELFSITPILETIQHIQAVPIPADQSVVPVKVRPLLTKLKQQLRERVVDVINSSEMEAATPDEMAAGVEESLKGEGIVFGQKPGSYGDIQRITLKAFASHPELLQANIKLGIPCGDDTSLSVIRKSGRPWKPILIVEANDFSEVGGAQNSFGYATSAVTAAGEFFIVATDLTPACSKMERSVRYKVLRPGPEAHTPEFIANDKAMPACVSGSPLAYKLLSDTDGVTLSFTDGLGDQEIQPRVKYAFVGDKVMEVLTIEQSLLGFLDVWRQFKNPNDVKRWIESPATDIVSCRQTKLPTESIALNCQSCVTTCSPNRQCRWIVFVKSGEWFLAVNRRSDGFFVQHINLRPATCLE
ncbi:MAG TPA: hypothetical protein VF766_01780 [Pyrinomonadaceae bacterium]